MKRFILLGVFPFAIFVSLVGFAYSTGSLDAGGRGEREWQNKESMRSLVEFSQYSLLVLTCVWVPFVSLYAIRHLGMYSRKRWKLSDRCRCGYDLRGLPGYQQVRCPECGHLNGPVRR